MNKIDNSVAGIVATLRGGIDSTADAELRNSMTIGWHPEFPAVDDENGVRLVGNRRSRIAAELGIEPVVKVVSFGEGEHADVERARFAVISNVGTAPLTATDRKRAAIYLTQTHGWSQEVIAKVIGVSQRTISTYLENLEATSKLPERAEKRGRPKAPPKQSKFKNPKITPKVEAEVASAVLDDGKTIKQTADDAGIGSEQVIKIIVAKESGRREVIEADPTLDLESYLSLTAQQKLQALEKRLMAKVDALVQRRTEEKNLKYVEEVLHPMFQNKLDEADQIIKRRRGVMSRAVYNKLRACLHTDTLSGLRAESYREGQYAAYAELGRPDLVPDGGQQTVVDAKVKTNARFDEAFSLLNGLQLMLLSETEMPTAQIIVPKTREEMMARKAATTAARNAKRSQRAALKSHEAKQGDGAMASKRFSHFIHRKRGNGSHRDYNELGRVLRRHSEAVRDPNTERSWITEYDAECEHVRVVADWPKEANFAAR